MVNRMITMIMLLCAVGRTLSSMNTYDIEKAGDDEDALSSSALFQQRTMVGSALGLGVDDGRLMMKSIMTAATDLVKSRVTPEVNSSIHELVTKIETDIEANIKADKNATQQALDSAVEAFGEAAQPIQDWKQSADSANQEYNTCMVAKNNLDIAHSECVTAQQGLDTTKGTKCAEQDVKQSRTYTFPTDLNCDFSTGRCDTHINTLNAAFDEWLASVRVLTNQAHTDYTNAKADCDDATSNLADKTAECQGKKALRDNKVLECEHKNAKQQISICTFGDKLQMKCDKKDHYTQLAAKVNEVNASHQHSHGDRKEEWTSTQLIKCTLVRHSQGHEFNSTSINHCTKTEVEATADFEENVGSIDLKESEYLSSLGEHFKCDLSMRSITFGTDNTQTFDSTLSNPPFSFCALTTKTCGDNFNCVVGGVVHTKKPATTTCQLESGCTTADCCEDAAVVTTSMTTTQVYLPSETFQWTIKHRPPQFSGQWRFENAMSPNPPAYVGPDRQGSQYAEGGDPSFFWVIDLGATKRIAELRVENEHKYHGLDGYYIVYDYEVGVSDDPDNFPSMKPGRFTSVDRGLVQTIRVEATGRYIRMNMLTYGKYSVGINHIEVTGEA